MLTTGEAAKYCGVHFRTVSRWIDKGPLKAHQLPGRGDNRIQCSDFVVFLRENDLPIPVELSEENRVLIIEDDPQMAKAIQRVLKTASHETLIVNSGFEAGAAIHEFQPQVVTLDLKMPGFDGFAVIEYIQQHIRPKPGILVVSAADAADLKKALTLGADKALEKPFESSDLLNELDGLIQQN